MKLLTFLLIVLAVSASAFSTSIPITGWLSSSPNGYGHNISGPDGFFISGGEPEGAPVGYCPPGNTCQGTSVNYIYVSFDDPTYAGLGDITGAIPNGYVAFYVTISVPAVGPAWDCSWPVAGCFATVDAGPTPFQGSVIATYDEARSELFNVNLSGTADSQFIVDAYGDFEFGQFTILSGVADFVYPSTPPDPPSVPEPATILLMPSGLVALFLFGLVRKRSFI